MKICTDCKWVDSNIEGFEKCTVKKNMKTSMIKGKADKRWKYCSTNREDGLLASYLFGTCGKRARWFEPKES